MPVSDVRHADERFGAPGENVRIDRSGNGKEEDEWRNTEVHCWTMDEEGVAIGPERVAGDGGCTEKT